MRPYRLTASRHKKARGRPVLLEIDRLAPMDQEAGGATLTTPLGTGPRRGKEHHETVRSAHVVGKSRGWPKETRPDTYRVPDQASRPLRHKQCTSELDGTL
jgi:hypothetical protein